MPILPSMQEAIQQGPGLKAMAFVRFPFLGRLRPGARLHGLGESPATENRCHPISSRGARLREVPSLPLGIPSVCMGMKARLAKSRFQRHPRLLEYARAWHSAARAKLDSCPATRDELHD